MSAFKKIKPSELSGNIFEMFNDGWALLTAQSGEKWNTMTISWGAAGILWNKPIVITYVRPSRETYKYTEADELCTVAFFDKKDCRSQLGLLGSKSGRDMDKMTEHGLTVEKFDGQIGFAEAKCVLVCKKLYHTDVEHKHIPDDARATFYANADKDNLHRVYTCEIVGCYVR